MIINVDNTLACPKYIDVKQEFIQEHSDGNVLSCFVYTISLTDLVSWFTADIAMNDGELLITCSNRLGIKHSSMFRMSEDTLWISGELYDRIIGWVGGLGD